MIEVNNPEEAVRRPFVGWPLVLEPVWLRFKKKVGLLGPPDLA
jgi:hypothetical protein